jgi:hypothetical protein
MNCSVCKSLNINLFTKVEVYSYYECSDCHVISIDSSIIKEIDDGLNIRKYDKTYWDNELNAAKKRAYGPCLARMAESIHYLQIPMNIFLDIGTGPGYFLDAVSAYLPEMSKKTYGIEKFPPEPEKRTKNNNYFMDDIKSFPNKVDCGLCMEVIEHITPLMFADILSQLAGVSSEGAIYLFNSGQPEFVKNEDISYLDPTIRGHIVSYSIQAVSIIAEPLGFQVHRLPGKTWAFVIEFEPSDSKNKKNIQDRIWNPLKQNLDLLTDFAGGSIFKTLGLESARAYG